MRVSFEGRIAISKPNIACTSCVVWCVKLRRTTKTFLHSLVECYERKRVGTVEMFNRVLLILVF